MEIILESGEIVAAHIEYGPQMACYVTEDGQRVSGDNAEVVLSPKLVARKLQVHEWQVRAWLRGGRLAGIKRPDGWRVRKSTLVGFVPPKRGRPPKRVREPADIVGGYTRAARAMEAFGQQCRRYSIEQIEAIRDADDADCECGSADAAGYPGSRPCPSCERTGGLPDPLED